MYLCWFHIKWNLFTVQNLWIRNKKITNFMFGLAVCILIDMFKSSVKVSETLLVKADTSRTPLVFLNVFWSLMIYWSHNDALDDAFIQKAYLITSVLIHPNFLLCSCLLQMIIIECSFCWASEFMKVTNLEALCITSQLLLRVTT